MNLLADDLDHVLAHTTGLWEELRGRRIFITGGTGFFGCWLLESFVWANERFKLGAEATVLTRDPGAFRRKAPHLAAHPAIGFHVGDVRNFDFPEGQFSHAIHAGSTFGVTAEPLEMFDTLVQGTRRVLEFAASHGVRKLLFTSSGAVYGKQPPEMTHVPETYAGAPDPMEPSSAYGEGKRAAELTCALMSRKHHFDIKIARCFAFVGPHLPLDAHFAIGNFIRDALAGGPVRVSGDGTPLRSYLYTADLAIWLWTILFKGAPGRAYNVGSDEAFSIGDIARSVQDTLSIEMVRATGPGADSGREPDRYVPSIRRAELELGLRSFHPLAQAIRRTVSWHRATHEELGRPKGSNIEGP